jgi:hypothetical protein
MNFVITAKKPVDSHLLLFQHQVPVLAEDDSISALRDVQLAQCEQDIPDLLHACITGINVNVESRVVILLSTLVLLFVYP